MPRGIPPGTNRARAALAARDLRQAADKTTMKDLGPTPLDDNYLVRKTLKLVKLFEGFSEQDAREFPLWARRHNVRPGERVIEEGKPGHEMCLVASGELSVVKSRGAVQEELARIEPGDSFGEVALVDCEPRSASVVALTPSILLRFERRFPVKIPQVSLKLYRNLATMMASRLRDTSTRVMLAKGPAIPASKRAHDTPMPDPPAPRDQKLAV